MYLLLWEKKIKTNSISKFKSNSRFFFNTLASLFYSKSFEKLNNIQYQIQKTLQFLKNSCSSLSLKIPWQITWHLLKILLFSPSASVDNKIYVVPDNKKLPFHPLG